MKLEQIPTIIGVILCLIAAGVIYDAVTPETARPFRERRRRHRAEINTPGEWLVALGIAALGGSLIAPEEWRWGTVAVMVGGTLLVLGGILNRAFLKEMLMFRGASRRAEELEAPPEKEKKDEPRLRIR